MTRTGVFLYVLVSVAGAAVLALEILGTRILGPSFGVSLFLWSALITVTLAALSLGYLAGGYLADRNPAVRRLCYIMALAGFWTVGIPWLRAPVVLLVDPWGLKAAILVSAAALFFPPLMFLGAVTPYVVRLKTATVESVGQTAGKLFALSTLASVVSALLTGFYLIPRFGVLLMTTSVGMLLLLTAAAGLFLDRGGRTGKIIAGILLTLAALTGWVAPVERADPGHGLLAVRQSPYAEIRVFDSRTGRHLLIDGGIHSRIDTARGTSTLLYTVVMGIPRSYFEKPGRMLLIGLGGGSLVREYLSEGWSVDAVEIDPVVIRTAKEYFDLPFREAGIFEMDGRRYLATVGKKYDVLLIDAFGSSMIPFHLVTREAFAQAAAVLDTDGILAINLICVGWDDPIVKMIASTLRTVFPYVLALPMAEPPDRLGNLIVLASNRTLDEIDEPAGNIELDPQWRFSPEYAVTHAWDNRFVPAIWGIDPLTDDLNPVDLRSEEIKTVARKDLRAYFAQFHVTW